jgi:kynureninase
MLTGCSFFLALVRISVLAPVSGRTTGGTVVTVTGTEFLAAAWCKFGTTATVSATVDTSTVLRCNSPAHSAGPVDVEVSVNGVDFTEWRTSFYYYGTRTAVVCDVRADHVAVLPTLTSIDPTTGPIGGASAVTLLGADFVGDFDPTCKFDTSRVAATVQTATVAVCLSPAHAAGAVTVAFSSNNADFTPTAAYIYQRTSAVCATLPFLMSFCSHCCGNESFEDVRSREYGRSPLAFAPDLT